MKTEVMMLDEFVKLNTANALIKLLETEGDAPFFVTQQDLDEAGEELVLNG